MDNNWQLAVWPDGEWSWRSNMAEMSHKSDDYQRFEVPEWADEMDCDWIADRVRKRPTSQLDVLNWFALGI